MLFWDQLCLLVEMTWFSSTSLGSACKRIFQVLSIKKHFTISFIKNYIFHGDQSSFPTFESVFAYRLKTF